MISNIRFKPIKRIDLSTLSPCSYIKLDNASEITLKRGIKRNKDAANIVSVNFIKYSRKSSLSFTAISSLARKKIYS